MDALKTSIQTAEMMVRMGLTHSTRTYPRPSGRISTESCSAED